MRPAFQTLSEKRGAKEGESTAVELWGGGFDLLSIARLP